jgi:hypothetical protein
MTLAIDVPKRFTFFPFFWIGLVSAQLYAVVAITSDQVVSNLVAGYAMRLRPQVKKQTVATSLKDP